MQFSKDQLYVKTVQAVRVSSGIKLNELGAKVTAMHQTRSGHLLDKLSRGKSSESIAGRLEEAVVANLGDLVGPVSN